MIRLVGFLLIALLNTCVNNAGETETFWVNGEKKICSGVGKQQCMLISYEDEPGEWEYFYSQIEGFDFEPGVMKQIKVNKTEKENVPADAAKYNYELVEVLQSKKMETSATNLNDIWALNTLMGKSFEDYEGERPTFEYVAAESRIGGNSGCNSYFGEVQSITNSEISFGPIGATKKACFGDHAEQDFFKMMNEVSSYKIENMKLHFFNDAGEQIAEFKKVD